MLADLVVNLFVAVVCFTSYACGGKVCHQLIRIFSGSVGNGKHRYLQRSQPQRERTCKMLGNNTDKSFDTAEYNSVYHNGTVLFTVCAGVLKLKSFGKLEVKLNSTALPGSSDTVTEMEVQFRTVECAVTFVKYIILAHIGNSSFKRFFCVFPYGFVTHMVFGHGGKLYLVGKTEEGIYLIKERNNVFDFISHLFLGHKDVSIVLSKASYAEQSVQSTGKLVSVYQTKLACTQGQITVRMRLVHINQHTAGAVHRLYCEILVIYLGGVHILLVVSPMSASFPQTAVKNNGGGNFHIAVSLMYFSPIIDKGVLKYHTVGKEEGESGAVVCHHKQTKLLAKLSVVAFFSFLKHIQVFIKLFLACKSSAVNTLKHLVVGIASPIRTGNGKQLKRLYLLCVGNVRACAKVGEFTLLVEGYLFAFVKSVNKLKLVRLVRHKLFSFVTGKGKALYTKIFFNNFLHFSFDTVKILGSEGCLGIEIVIKSGVDSRADSQTGIGIKSFYCLRQNMRRRVSQRSEFVKFCLIHSIGLHRLLL